MAAPPNERIASLEVEMREVMRRLSGQGGTLYGLQGNGGLQADVRGLLDLVERHIRDCGKAHDRTAVLLVGENGDAGLVADVKSLKTDFKRVMALAKALGVAVLTLLVEAGRRIIAWALGR